MQDQTSKEPKLSATGNCLIKHNVEIFPEHNEPTLEDLKIARISAAVSVRSFGEIFLPLFKRLDDEIKLREENLTYLDEALKYADLAA